MDGQHEKYLGVKKKQPSTERKMTTALYLLRCSEVGIAIADLDLLTIGVVLDMFTEKGNDNYDYAIVATQDDFDRF